MARVAYVLRVKGSRAWVSTQRRGICTGCSEAQGCGMGAGGAEGGPLPDVIPVENPVGARPGDTVEIDLPGHTELRVSLLVWAVPVVGLIAGAAGGAALHGALGMGQDPATALGAVAGLGLSYGLLALYDRRHARHDPRLVPHVLRVVEDAASCASPPGSCTP